MDAPNAAVINTLTRHDAPAGGELAGALAPAEASAREKEAHRILREQLGDQKYEAVKMREWYEAELKRRLPPGFKWDDVQAYAEWTAREVAIRDQMDRMGFRSE
jgi:hypothetical protein